MALSDGDKAEIKEMAREIVKEVLVAHVMACPHGQLIMKSKALIIGLCIGSGLASGGVVIGAFKLITGN